MTEGKVVGGGEAGVVSGELSLGDAGPGRVQGDDPVVAGAEPEDTAAPAAGFVPVAEGIDPRRWFEDPNGLASEKPAAGSYMDGHVFGHGCGCKCSVCLPYTKPFEIYGRDIKSIKELSKDGRVIAEAFRERYGRYPTRIEQRHHLDPHLLTLIDGNAQMVIEAEGMDTVNIWSKHDESCDAVMPQCSIHFCSTCGQRLPKMNPDLMKPIEEPDSESTKLFKCMEEVFFPESLWTEYELKECGLIWRDRFVEIVEKDKFLQRIIIMDLPAYTRVYLIKGWLSSDHIGFRFPEWLRSTKTSTEETRMQYLSDFEKAIKKGPQGDGTLWTNPSSGNSVIVPAGFTSDGMTTNEEAWKPIGKHTARELESLAEKIREEWCPDHILKIYKPLPKWIKRIICMIEPDSKPVSWIWKMVRVWWNWRVHRVNVKNGYVVKQGGSDGQ